MNLEKLGLIELNKDDIVNTQGGFGAGVLAAVAVLGFVCTVGKDIAHGFGESTGEAIMDNYCN